MPLDMSIWGTGGGGVGAEPQQSPFDLVNQFTKLKTLQQDQQQRALEMEKQQRALDNDDAVDQALQNRARIDPNGQPDIDKTIADLHMAGRGSSALTLQGRVFAWNKDNASTLKDEAATRLTRLEMGSRMAQSITDEASFNRLAPQINALIPEARSVLGTSYDPNRVKQAMTMGQSNADHLTEQKNIFDQSMRLLDYQQTLVRDGNNLNEKLPMISTQWTNILSRSLSLAKSQQDWDASLNLAKRAMAGLPNEVAQQVLGNFSPTFSNSAKEDARKTGMTQNEQSQEADRRAHLSIEQQKEAAEAQQMNMLTPEAIDMIALSSAKGAPMPALGLGTAAAKMRVQILNRMPEMFGNLDLATQQVAYKANNRAISNLTNTLANVTAFENTALKNLKVFLDAAAKIPDTGSPFLNKPLRSIDQHLLGSSEMAVFNAAHEAVVPEFARIIAAGPSLSNIVTNESRDKIDTIMKTDYTLQQLLDSSKVLVKDAANRKQSYQDELDARMKMMKTPPPMATGSAGGSGGGTGGGPGAAGSGALKPNSTQTVYQNGIAYSVTTDAKGNVISSKQLPK